MSISADVDLVPWQTLFDRLPFPAVVVERHTTRLLRANRPACKLLDLDRPPTGIESDPRLGDLVTRPLPDLVDDLRIAAGGGDLPVVLVTDPGADGPQRHSCQVIPIAFGGQPIDRWLVTFACNVASRGRLRNLSSELRQANEVAANERYLRRRMTTELETLERFAQAMAHDLKGPLRHIATLLPAIEESLGSDLPPDSAHLMELAHQSAQRGRELVDALLDHAGAVSGQIEMRPVDLDHIVEASLASQRWVLDGVPHRASLGGPLGTIEADPSLVHLLVDNLISNAMKYRDPDRVLEIEIGSGPDGAILEITDNGIGFDPADATRIFEPFIRLGAEVPGHGVGLATCLTVCERHGWKILADGRPGRGARFQVRRT